MEYSDNGQKPVVHSFADQNCPCCKQPTRLHCLELPTFRLAVCSLCGRVIREAIIEGLPKIKQLKVPYPPSLDSGEVRCHSCNCQVRVDSFSGRAICLEPTCGHSWRLPVKSRRERALEKEKKEVLKRIAAQVADTYEYAPADKTRLEEINRELVEARK